MSSSDEEIVSPPPKKATSSGVKKKADGQTYKKYTDIEHILECPEMYMGSNVGDTDNMWVYDPEEKKLEKKEIKYPPGLYKIFDEILVNAADNKQRGDGTNRMKEIRVEIKQKEGVVSVWNDGPGIPTENHEKEKMPIPTMIFGHLRTSSNYSKEEDRVTGGLNGLGAKLTNIYSKQFIVQTASNNREFRQEWTENMSKAGTAQIEKRTVKDYTKITFKPDLARFGIHEPGFPDGLVQLMSRRVLDLAGTVRDVKVKLNGNVLPVDSFEAYCKLYLKDRQDEMGTDLELVAQKLGKDVKFHKDGVRWEVAVAPSPTGEFLHCSFVNGIATKRGGKHVDHVANLIADIFKEALAKKNKTGHNITPAQIKQHFWVFINCLITKPKFDSQTKDVMNLPATQFGSKFVLTDDFKKKLLKMGIVESILLTASHKAKSKLDRVGGVKTSKLKGIAKLEDANDAGTRHSADCTLILTEGDSAKALVVSGFSVVGRDKYGVFPLRGKLLNVREASAKQLMDNAEIQNIVKILGLKFKCKYDSEQDMKSLRYGRLMIMTDQDQDGSHIKGLLINFIHHQWPGLLHRRFLEQFITPIVKATKGDTEHSFYSLPEFEEWKAVTADWHKYRVKYFKGLGTSTSKEAKEYFQNMARHQIEFKWRSKSDDDCIELAFAKGNADARKKWLTDGMKDRVERRERGEPEIFLYEKTTKQVTYSDFVNKELILFSNADNERSIPSMVDGLKPGQRKVMFTCFKRNDKREVKVAQLSGAVAEHSAYHHGEVSLQSTIVNLAQDYTGSNNINLLMPCGQFGTRLQGGKDNASARYIFTMLSPLARAIFSPLDAPLLHYLQDDNQKIEPEYYMPILPMVLVNGADGIGTGWMTKIPNYNPRDIVANLKRMMKGEPQQHMMPWWKGYTGEIKELDGGGKYVAMGEIAISEEENRVEITELPVRTWTQAYKESVIEPMVTGSEKAGKVKPPQITEYREYHTDTTVRFVVHMNNTKFKEFEKDGWHKVFKLHSTISMSSMVLFDSKGVITKYDSVSDMMTEFFNLRLEFYRKRKTYWLAALSAEAKKLENQARFIQEKIEGKIKVEDVKRAQIVKRLVELKYDSDPVKTWKKSLGAAAMEEQVEPTTTEEADDAVEKAAETGPDYDYLMGMTFWRLSNEQKIKLLEERDKKNAEVKELRLKSEEQLWNADLDAFLDKLDETENAEHEAQGGTVKGSAQKPAIKGGKGAGRAKKAYIPNKKDTLPDRVNFSRIEPVVHQGLIESHEKAKDLKERKAKGEVGPKLDEDGNPIKRARAKKPAELDADGNPVKPKRAPKAKNEDGDDDEKKSAGGKKLKQDTLDGKFSKKKKADSSEEESDFDSEELSSEGEESDVKMDDSGSDEYEFDKSQKTKKSNGVTSTVQVTKPDSDDDIMEITEVKPLVTKSKSTVIEPDQATSKSNGAAKKKITEASSKASNGNGTPTKGVKLVSSSEDEDEKPVLKKAAPVKKPVVTKKPTITTVSSDEEDDYKPVVKKPAPLKLKKTEAKPAAGSSDEELMPLVAQKTAPLKLKKPETKPAAYSDDELVPVFAQKSAPLKLKKPEEKPAGKKTLVKRKVVNSDSEDEFAPGPSGASKGAAKKPKNALDDSDDDEIPPPPRNRPARAAAAAAAKKVISDSSIENMGSDDEHLETID